MTDFILAGCVYVPAYFFGRWLTDYTGWDGFVIGWLIGSTAVLARWQIPGLRVRI
jgi:hypothetical protein